MRLGKNTLKMNLKKPVFYANNKKISGRNLPVYSQVPQ